MTSVLSGALGGILGALAVQGALWLLRRVRVTVLPPNAVRPAPGSVARPDPIPDQRFEQEVPQIITRLAKDPKYQHLTTAEREAAAEQIARAAQTIVGKHRRGV